MPGGAAGRVLVLQHLAAEGPGLLGDYLREAGMVLEVVELDEGERIPSLLDFDLMLVMGGAMDVWHEDRFPWLALEKAAIREWVRELGRPYLGVCLGHQLLADATGGAVGLMPTPEIGVMEMAMTPDGMIDPVFSQLPPAVRGLQWHGAQVIRLPVDGVVLAGNDHCAMQAIRIGARAWGVQFHLEVDEATISEWALVPEYRSALAEHGRDSAWLNDAVALHLDSMKDNALTLLTAMLGTVRGDRAQRSEPVR
jgi:GMP synthase-like glutamine amidotransferase